jgi:phosphoenolpyruvate-protein kinase (PTS system EI component)
MDEMGDGEIVFRTLDIGGDKILHYFPPGEESNPFLGLRGIRFTLHHPRIFETQVRAVLRAIKTVAEAAHRHGKPLSICGDMAHTPEFIPVLIGMGLTAFTIPPHRIAQVQTIIQATQAAEAEALSRRVLATATVAEIARLLGIPYVSP